MKQNELSEAPLDEPQSAEEWQAAVDKAYACLLVGSRKEFALILGRLIVNTERCNEILVQGRERGVEPSPESDELAQRVLQAMTALGHQAFP